MIDSLRRIEPSFREKIWGSTRLSPWFPDSDRKIGEVWFEAGSPSFPLLTKFIFTSEHLSVQVHPDDARAAEWENSRGKTEMWYVLRADPGAQVALGLRESLSPERLRAAAQSGEIMNLLNWIDVSPGQSLLVPAGAIHALGAGLAVLEIQQHSDVTYRLYDYGRPRELHLEKAVGVSVTDRHTHAAQPAGVIARCGYFVVDAVELGSAADYSFDHREHQLIVLDGEAEFAGQPAKPGDVWHVAPGVATFPIRPTGDLTMIRAYVPEPGTES